MNKTNVLWRSHRPSSPSAKKVRYDAFLAARPGLREALMHAHRISMDLDAKLMAYGSISEAQIALAFKLYADAFCPARPSEINVPAPTGRQTIRGTVVSVKDYENDFRGVTLKMTVKVTTGAGTWLCWGTVPSNLTSTPVRIYQSDPVTGPSTEVVKGTEVEFTATLQAGREPHFAFFKRPTNARIISVVTCAKESAPHPADVEHTCVQAFDAAPAVEVEARPGMAVNVVGRMNAEMGIATRGYGS